MEYKIIEKPAFTFAGVSKRVPLQYEGVNNAILELAESITQEQKEEMHRLQNIEPYETVNVSYESDTNFLEEAGELTHLIGVLTTKNDTSSNLDTFPVKAHTWAVFPNEGVFPFTLQDTMAKIYSEWFLTADYELAEPFSFSFTKMDDKKPNYAYSEIWIPVIKKESAVTLKWQTQPSQSTASKWAAPTVDSPVCPCWWVIKGRQQKVLPPFPIIEERGIFHD